MQRQNEDIIYLIKCLDKELAMDFDKRLAEVGLTGQQGIVLFFINCQTNLKHNVVHQNDIEKNFNLSKSTVSGLVDRLLKKGLIEKVTEPPYVCLKPTLEGVNTIEAVQKNKTDTIKKLTKNLDEDEVYRMIENIKKLIKNIKEGEENV